jgi:hypothetical protein
LPAARRGRLGGNQRRGGARLCQANAIAKEVTIEGKAVGSAVVRAGLAMAKEADGVTKTPECISSWQRRH